MTTTGDNILGKALSKVDYICGNVVKIMLVGDISSAIILKFKTTKTSNSLWIGVSYFMIIINGRF